MSSQIPILNINRKQTIYYTNKPKFIQCSTYYNQSQYRITLVYKFTTIKFIRSACCKLNVPVACYSSKSNNLKHIEHSEEKEAMESVNKENATMKTYETLHIVIKQFQRRVFVTGNDNRERSEGRERRTAWMSSILWDGDGLDPKSVDSMVERSCLAGTIADSGSRRICNLKGGKVP